MKKHVRDFKVSVDYDIDSLRGKYPIANVTVSAQITGPVLTAVQEETAKPHITVDEFYNSQRRVLDLIWNHCPKVERVIFNGPATIVFWDDGEKTVVKCRECDKCLNDRDYPTDPIIIGDIEVPAEVMRAAHKVSCRMAFDPEKAVMAAMLKRLYKNYQDVLREALGVEDGR